MVGIGIVAWSKKSLFPHISRIFPASLLIVSTLFFVISIIWSKFQQQDYRWYRQNLLAHPFETRPYEEFQSVVTRQLPFRLLIADTTGMQNVLGASTKQEDTYFYWKTRVDAFPSYRDGYIQLALSAYRTNRLDEARSALQEALTLDLNNQWILQLWREMGL